MFFVIIFKKQHRKCAILLQRNRRLTDYAVRTLLLTYGSSGNAQLRSVRIIWAVAGAVYGAIAIITNSVIGRKKNNFPKRGKQMSDVIEIKNLRKSFGEVKAVQDISFCVKQGEMFAFLGVNGAGKSTTISIICGYLAKDGGSVEVCGKSIDNSIDDFRFG